MMFKFPCGHKTDKMWTGRDSNREIISHYCGICGKEFDITKLSQYKVIWWQFWK